MFKRLFPIVLIVFAITACDVLNATEEAVIDEAESVAQEATDVPVEPTDVEPTTEPTDMPTVEPTAEPTLEPTPAPVSDSAYNGPEWTNLPLVNARTGETFTLASFAGKTVFVEPMATWCTNCRAQQGYVRTAMESLDEDDFVFISLSVGENVSNQVLANYAVDNNFPQVFAVATDEITAALIENFGFSVTTPPSTPHFTISPTGVVSDLSTGFDQPDAIIEQVTTVHNS